MVERLIFVDSQIIDHLLRTELPANELLNPAPILLRLIDSADVARRLPLSHWACAGLYPFSPRLGTSTLLIVAGSLSSFIAICFALNFLPSVGKFDIFLFWSADGNSSVLHLLVGRSSDSKINYIKNQDTLMCSLTLYPAAHGEHLPIN